jgi:hypothetical protein
MFFESILTTKFLNFKSPTVHLASCFGYSILAVVVLATMEKPVSTNMPASVFVQGTRYYRMNSCALWSVFFHYLHAIKEKPVSANMPASVFVQGTRYWMNSCAPLDLVIPPPIMGVSMPLHDLLEQWVDDPQFLLEQVHIPEDGGVALAQGIIQGSAQAVSDGSYKPGVIGTAVCVLLLRMLRIRTVYRPLIWFQVGRMINPLTAVS